MTTEIMEAIANKAGGQLDGLITDNAEELAGRFNEVLDAAEGDEIMFNISATVKVNRQKNGDHACKVQLSAGKPFSAKTELAIVGNPNQDELPLDK